MKKILIVDDDEAIVEAVSFVMEEEGYEVRGITRGDETCTIASSFKPDIILLDYLLSGKDGVEILNELKAESDLEKIPVIMFSAHPNAVKFAKAAGAEGFIPKPFDINELISLIHKLIK